MGPVRGRLLGLGLCAWTAHAEPPSPEVSGEQGVEAPEDPAVAEAAPPEAPDPAMVRGERLAGLAGCAACHTAEDGAPFAGGHALHTDFGTFHGSNLTPDPEHGLGGWTFEDFHRAMREGKRPDGRSYYPSFPFTSFTGLTDDDLSDLWAFLQTVPADPRPDEPHDLRRGYRKRWVLGLWRTFAFRKGPFEADADDPVVARGEYLVDVVGHCGECHTPRSGLGALKRRRWLAGSDAEPEPAPNITPHDDGVGSWELDDWLTFLDMGMLPDGDWVGGEMARIVEEGTAPLSEADREAMARYLMSVPAEPSR